MSISLADALEEVELEAGQTYCCEVRGRHIELRVLAEQRPTVTSGVHPDDIMLDAWCELPGPTPLSRGVARPIASHPFDIPEIPTDEDWA